ncbi:MAG: GvpL/GvpF family gas vesicle protein [Syntrophales bacterium]|nr:GvpL/GvpF family gas vesicle protein [Syntrophales bacterium]
MGGKATKNEGKYLYAVIPAAGDREYGDIGIDGERVYLIADNQVGAVVSNFSNGKIRPERRHISAHQAVLKRLMEEETPLPISFGVIAEGAKEIKRILSLNRKSFAEELRRVHGKVEMGLRVAWDVPNIFEYFVNTHTEIRAARDQFLGSNRAPTQEDKIEVGRLFDRVLQEDREELTERVEAIISPCCFEIRRNPTRSEKEIMSLACLVGREAVDKDFEAAIFEAARGFDNNFSFDFNGPWAPHNFVDMDLKL